MQSQSVFALAYNDCDDDEDLLAKTGMFNPFPECTISRANCEDREGWEKRSTHFTIHIQGRLTSRYLGT